MAKPVSMDDKVMFDMAEALREALRQVMWNSRTQPTKNKMQDALRSYDARENSKRFHGNPAPPQPQSVNITLPQGVSVVTVTLERDGHLLVMDAEQAQLLGACPSSSYHHSRCVK